MATARNASHGSTTALLNFVALLCSIPVIGAGIWLSSKQDNECVHLARWPVVILGVLLLLASLAGFVGAYWNRPALLAAYFSCMAALIVILFSLVAFAYAVTAPDGSYAVPGRAYREYRLAGYSDWLRHYALARWPEIRLCLSASELCREIGRDRPYLTAYQFFHTELSPLQQQRGRMGEREKVASTACGWGWERTKVSSFSRLAEGDSDETPSIMFSSCLMRKMGAGATTTPHRLDALSIFTP
ncbi:hypothetical protein ZIOFF_022156 [Zingiber officinale]|uniref:Uncharacterized protein n=1 Tax=Zingiber officinale TaxID=94328 RepID=A0A8J5HL06_ZINOF|nr:hypothetical protein ZIOFF_022156 [Zingiber officinale]